MTQCQLADKLLVSDKTISKWETGKGYPDITLLEPIAEAFSVSITELISGDEIKNTNVSANMMRSIFYVCTVCGNVIHSMGEAAIHCHGVLLKPAQAEQTDENHKIFVERVEDGLFALDLVKGIDDREKSYDDTEKRRALEQVAKMLFG